MIVVLLWATVTTHNMVNAYLPPRFFASVAHGTPQASVPLVLLVYVAFDCH